MVMQVVWIPAAGSEAAQPSLSRLPMEKKGGL